MGLLISNSHRNSEKKILLAIGIICNLSLMFYFKYANFAVDNIKRGIVFRGCKAARTCGYAHPARTFLFVFQAMSYIIDIYRNDTTPQKNPLSFSVFLTLFPNLVAGPIVR